MIMLREELIDKKEMKSRIEKSNKRRNTMVKKLEFVRSLKPSDDKTVSSISLGDKFKQDKEMYEKTINKIAEGELKNSSIQTYLLLNIYIIYLLKDNELLSEFRNFYKRYIKDELKIEKYMEKINRNKEHNYMLLLLEDYINGKDINTELYNDTTNNELDKNKLEEYNILEFNKIKEELEHRIDSFNKLNKKLILMLETSNIENKDNKRELIRLTVEKFEEKNRINCVYNKPELLIYNNLVRKSKTDDRIKYIGIHFVLPVKNKRNLIADIIILLRINEKYKFGIIEFDGASHYLPSDYRFDELNIKRDQIKNQFSKENQISLLRIPYNELNIEYKLNDFIYRLLNGELINDYPSDDYYKTLSLNYNLLCKTKWYSYIKSQDNIIPLAKYDEVYR
jgi:hypothetical protein